MLQQKELTFERMLAASFEMMFVEEWFEVMVKWFEGRSFERMLMLLVEGGVEEMEMEELNLAKRGHEGMEMASIEWMGMVIDDDGLDSTHPTPKKKLRRRSLHLDCPCHRCLSNRQ